MAQYLATKDQIYAEVLKLKDQYPGVEVYSKLNIEEDLSEGIYLGPTTAKPTTCPLCDHPVLTKNKQGFGYECHECGHGWKYRNNTSMSEVLNGSARTKTKKLVKMHPVDLFDAKLLAEDKDEIVEGTNLTGKQFVLDCLLKYIIEPLQIQNKTKGGELIGEAINFRAERQRLDLEQKVRSQIGALPLGKTEVRDLINSLLAEYEAKLEP